MRKIRAGFMLALPVVASLMAACGSTSSGVATGCKPADNINTSQLNLVVPGKLTIASDATYPPQESKDPTTGKYVGSDIDIANEIAKRMCLTPFVQNVQFSTIIAGITSSSAGQQYYDMSLSAFTINPDRQKLVNMIPYFTAGESLLVPKGNPKHITALKDLCGLAVAVESGTVEHDEIAGTGDPKNPGLNETGGACASNKVKLLTYDTQDKAIQELLSGSADAGYQDSPVTGFYAKQNSDKLDLGPTTVTPSPEGIVVRNDNKPFQDAITQVLNDMRADGTYKSILSKWGVLEDAYPPLNS